MRSVYLLLVLFGISNYLFADSSCCPLSAKLTYEAGVVKEAAAGRSQFSRLIFPAGGTIQFWVKLDKKANTLSYSHPWGIGVNDAGWFTSFVSNGKFVVRTRSKAGSSSCSISVAHWQVGEWHNLAISWGTYHKKSYILLYEDGQLKGKNEQALLPAKFNRDIFCIGFNSASYSSANFAGAIDEFCCYTLPLTPEAIKANYLLGKEHIPLALQKGMSALIHFDGSAACQSGVPTSLEGRSLKKQLKRALALPRPQKYDNELSVAYSYDRSIKEKRKLCLTDGDDNTIIAWRQHPLEVIVELPSTTNLSLIEIVAPKLTKWYQLEELHISLDDGSGQFTAPHIIKTYGKTPAKTQNVIDQSCKTYHYQWLHPGKACRVKIVPKGKGYMALGEVRFCGKPVH